MQIIDAPAGIALFGSAWLAVASWALSTWLRFPWSRLFWTVGCLANLGHVLLAMHTVHGWDHDLAYASVAKQTYEETGLDSGVGLHINYGFSALWLVDSVAWWLAPHRYARRSRWLAGGLQFVFLFMFFNATVVFGKSPVRFLGALLCPLAAISWLRPLATNSQSA